MGFRANLGTFFIWKTFHKTKEVAQNGRRELGNKWCSDE